jgi:hypothetical protein
VAIRTSSSAQIDALVAALSAPKAATREAAIARLTLIGPRALDRLAALATSTAESGARVAALLVLEAIADARALDAALRCLEDGDAAVAGAAVAAAGVFLRGARGAAVVDRLTALTLDTTRPVALRVAALTTLGGLSRATMLPILTALAEDSSDAMRAEAAALRTTPPARNPLDALVRAADQPLPDDPEALRAAIVGAGASAPLSVLLRIVERVRERESAEAVERRPAWTTTRVAAHAALARRGSRLALYDLRELLAAATGPLPVEFLAALSEIGDASCLEAVAGAYVRSAGRDASRPDWWRQHLANAFRAIVVREGLSRRHAVVKKVEKRWPGTWTEVTGQ